ncbi:MAG: zinc metallopeptidase [Planctomycetes bacterium]|nr:zinc metallopeptidase [Planctomycetota bacterium]
MPTDLPIQLAIPAHALGYGYGYGIDPLWLVCMVPALLLSLWAQWRVKSTFARFAEVRAASGVTGAEAARRLLRTSGCSDVRIEEVPGFLSDHYDPSAKTLRLSPDVFGGSSLAALGVAAHEAGHAIQHKVGYGPLALRTLLVKPCMIGSNLSMILIFFGGFLMYGGGGPMAHAIAWIGVGGFALAALFTLVTLPVEFNASARAVVALRECAVLRPDEEDGARAVLDAAAMTYVAAAVAAVLQLLYWMYRLGLLGGRRSNE